VAEARGRSGHCPGPRGNVSRNRNHSRTNHDREANDNLDNLRSNDNGWATNDNSCSNVDNHATAVIYWNANNERGIRGGSR
jgi:hypothetical protein